MELQFKPRVGDLANWSRVLVVKDSETGDRHPFTLLMETKREMRDGQQVAVRRGRVFRTTIDEGGSFVADTDTVLWEGELPEGPPPGRAFALAAGLCDENGESKHLALPAWAR